MPLQNDGSRKKDRRVPKGLDLLHTPRLNKGTAFSEEERDVFNLRGLLPPRVLTPELQEVRVMENFRGGDYWAWAREVDVISNDHSPMAHDPQAYQTTPILTH